MCKQNVNNKSSKTTQSTHHLNPRSPNRHELPTGDKLADVLVQAGVLLLHPGILLCLWHVDIMTRWSDTFTWQQMNLQNFGIALFYDYCLAADELAKLWNSTLSMILAWQQMNLQNFGIALFLWLPNSRWPTIPKNDQQVITWQQIIFWFGCESVWPSGN